MLHRFSKRCRPFNQNGTERNDKNYGKKTTVPRVFYGTEFGTFFWRLLYYIYMSFLLGTKGCLQLRMWNYNIMPVIWTSIIRTLQLVVIIVAHTDTKNCLTTYLSVPMCLELTFCWSITTSLVKTKWSTFLHFVFFEYDKCSTILSRQQYLVIILILYTGQNGNFGIRLLDHGNLLKLLLFNHLRD